MTATPDIDAFTRASWDAAAEGRLLIRRCRACGRPHDVEEGHVWSQAGGFTDDQVPLGGKFAGLGHNSDWWQDLLPFGSVWGQNVLSDESFGANTMAHDSGSHTDYWRDGSLSIQNQVSVVAGQYDKVQRD